MDTDDLIVIERVVVCAEQIDAKIKRFDEFITKN